MLKRIDVSALLLCSALALLAPGAARAQRAGLEQAETLLKAGETEQARAALEQWRKDNPAERRTALESARATYLTARLTTDVTAAYDVYYAIALSEANSPYAAEALLRLGQIDYANGELARSIDFLQRLQLNYPRSEHRGMGMVWLARAQLAAGKPDQACQAVTQGLAMRGLDAETNALLKTEEPAACANRSAAAPAKMATPPRANTPQPSLPGAATTSRFAIQVAAFRERAGATSVARQLEKAGYEGVRIVTVPDNTLLRVRVGKFESSSAAAPTIAKLKAAGFSAVVVSDALREQSAR